jgi:hypothetical protein
MNDIDKLNKKLNTLEDRINSVGNDMLLLVRELKKGYFCCPNKVKRVKKEKC